MRRFVTLSRLLVAAMLGGLLAHPVSAQPLTVERYCALSVARLEAAVHALAAEGRALTDADEDSLWQSAGTTRDAFYGYAGANSQAIGAYLTDHPDTRDRIQSLSAQFRNLVEDLDKVGREKSP